MDTIETISLNVLIQENGIIRNQNGHIIGRLSNDLEFNSEHIKGLPMPQTNNQSKPVEGLDELIRDITKAGSISKSEVRRRLNEIIHQEIDRAVEEYKQKCWEGGHESAMGCRIKLP